MAIRSLQGPGQTYELLRLSLWLPVALCRISYMISGILLLYCEGGQPVLGGSVKGAVSETKQKEALTPADYNALAAFRYAVRRYLAFADAGARSVGLTSQQHQALLSIKAHAVAKPMSIGDLAGQLLIQHHSAVELLGRLQKAGLTRRSVDPGDRRRVNVTLTEAGEKVLAALSGNNLRELQVAVPAFAGLMDQLEKLGAEQFYKTLPTSQRPARSESRER